MRMRWCVLAVVVSALVACTKPCNASTCDGCCFEGECVAGTSRFECGRGGAECTRCTSSERCAAAVCEAVPEVDAGVVDAGPVSCTCQTACCLPDGTCSPNNDIGACGPAKTFCGTCQETQRCQQGLCVAAACSGCLDGLGQCRVGTAVTACGRDGGVCEACLTEQACVLGACAYTRCDETNCRFGCCQPDKRCETNVGVSACGLNGASCASCGTTQQCIGGTCQ